MKFGAILADVPWHWKNWGRDVGKRSAASYYSVMSVEDIANVPVGDVAADDCVLFFWVAWPMLFGKDGSPVHYITKSWGFEYKTLAFDWVKITKNWKQHFGMGYWSRANSEICLLFFRGHPKRMNAGVHSLIWEEYEPQVLAAKIGDHSEKPEAQYDKIESLVGGPYLELFGRKKRKGWTVLGNEIDGQDIQNSVRRLKKK